ncbi:hypothetical protein SAMN05216251_12815 [Actinacidiphila alni]|uniref:Sodium:proton antiporter n=1 Tax=Actinacidiphila alni TaxID=380248 RepID=A0A1I2LE32_9ACTN|nr:DUF6328 family protein [Actinacidiphila alni]SFF76808.1 hypothetical protein SAMN05216251_12815 [Actinacidiphila alni]
MSVPPPASTGPRHRPDPDADDGVHTGLADGLEEENDQERANRRWGEVLQETRVAQMGVQILFGFLLSISFTPHFRQLETFDLTVYVTAVVSGALATGALIAPASIHRILAGQSLKQEIIGVAGRLMVCGMALLALTVACVVLLILHVALDDVVAEIVTGVVALWFVGCWYGLPVWLRRRTARHGQQA